MVRKVAAAILILAAAGVGCSQPLARASRADVQAANACQVFYLYLTFKTTGSQVMLAVQPLLTAASDAKALGKPAPRWATLGHDIVEATGAAFTNNGAKLKLVGDKAAKECASIPSAAKIAVGYNH